MLPQECINSRSDELAEYVPEALKNLLNVMSATGVLVPTWQAISHAVPSGAPFEREDLQEDDLHYTSSLRCLLRLPRCKPAAELACLSQSPSQSVTPEHARALSTCQSCALFTVG